MSDAPADLLPDCQLQYRHAWKICATTNDAMHVENKDSNSFERSKSCEWTSMSADFAPEVSFVVMKPPIKSWEPGWLLPGPEFLFGSFVKWSSDLHVYVPSPVKAPSCQKADTSRMARARNKSNWYAGSHQCDRDVGGFILQKLAPIISYEAIPNFHIESHCDIRVHYRHPIENVCWCRSLV